MMTLNFIPQPYPLFAVPLELTDYPKKFRVADIGVQLVTGWSAGGQGRALPNLGGVMPFSGEVIFEETRERAERTAQLISQGGMTVVRSAGCLVPTAVCA